METSGYSKITKPMVRLHVDIPKNTCKYKSTWIDRLGDTNDTIETKLNAETARLKETKETIETVENMLIH